MGKINSQTLEAKTVHKPVHKPEAVYYVGQNVDVNAWAVRLTSIGYDNEIGLWEELEHRNRLNCALPK